MDKVQSWGMMHLSKKAFRLRSAHLIITSMSSDVLECVVVFRLHTLILCRIEQACCGVTVWRLSGHPCADAVDSASGSQAEHTRAAMLQAWLACSYKSMSYRRVLGRVAASRQPAQSLSNRLAAPGQTHTARAATLQA
jgi:hypothetical protein